jgi:Rps23 Pro-64 3,4-dihydroxylase Tpa1-like proline 4-hydroxylase
MESETSFEQRAHDSSTIRPHNLLNRTSIGNHIAAQLGPREQDLANQWRSSSSLHHFCIDNLLPTEWADRIKNSFPAPEAMTLKRSLRELKFVAAQMNKYDPLLEETIYAFQEPSVVALIGKITSLRDLQPDSLLYAGGISTMSDGHFLNPHIDNSHDKLRQRYRVLNLLYYVSPDWHLESGGNLELWPDGPRGNPTTIVSKFNRLVVMVTDRHSWHSVSRVRTNRTRHCVSNYYFSKHPVGGRDYFHVTSFRGRPEQPIRDLILRLDIALRGGLRMLFPQGIRDNPHFYRKDT